MAATGKPIRVLSKNIPELPSSLNAALINDGILAIQGSPIELYEDAPSQIAELINVLEDVIDVDDFPLIIICDDPHFLASDFNNFLWATFTRSNPSHDVYGIKSKTEFKHWGCSGSLIIDARFKPHNAPPLIEDEKITSRVDEFMKKLED